MPDRMGLATKTDVVEDLGRFARGDSRCVSCLGVVPRTLQSRFEPTRPPGFAHGFAHDFAIALRPNAAPSIFG